MYKIDLNSDLGESFGAYKIGSDEEILKYVTSVNIACGFHAGDPSVMRKTVKNALLNNVSIGAHPGLPDLIGFGRRNMSITPDEAYDMVIYQVGALYGFIKAEGGTMQHVKPHGALYNMAAKDGKLAIAIAQAVYDINPELILFGLAGSESIKQGLLVGLRTASEVFADRTYQNDGSLTPRSQSDAMVTDEKESIERVIRMVKDKKVKCQQGNDIGIEAETVCIHGDSAKALNFALEINNTLTNSGIEIISFE
ncbi:LamB/YcsF family protein [Clostridium beijerinckii]|uniref:5-oxoprolinase subunit A n=1 Tax=Clostridium beijerinckii TaxID=1520 RepID=A0A1S9N6G6_CLOBE|nr:5-oxoprolinase subunit PxpA [Clostridium beijerinckii]MZK50900.1 5-oxoprolinase subunit PxpA [Clostridium beijerinckii]MZK59102.1 5-oxoprolinase subunit PxpA [Clostridium beijerinckii]MZK69221.1 5-oxoprolinase subunit PxpA [Clostridium beijerinckii]MZK74593.1 5-oxoprolinase subunit PxpA [Clostridium beijerinckii]MZK84313.1 5-oxoprolinase subunit PxpA [Clostridium beijerinckii]